MSNKARFSDASVPIIISFKVVLFLPLKMFEILPSSALKIGLPTIEGKTEVGKFAFANPALTN